MPKRKRLTKEQRMAVYNKFGGHCAYCGCELEYKDMQADHIEPLELGGADEISNLYPACRSCNHYKHTFTVERFREALEHMPNVLMRDSVTYKIAVRFGLVKQAKEKVFFFFEKVAEREKRDCKHCDYLNVDNGMFCCRFNCNVTKDDWCYQFIPRDGEQE